MTRDEVIAEVAAWLKEKRPRPTTEAGWRMDALSLYDAIAARVRGEDVALIDSLQRANAVQGDWDDDTLADVRARIEAKR